MRAVFQATQTHSCRREDGRTNRLCRASRVLLCSYAMVEPGLRRGRPGRADHELGSWFQVGPVSAATARHRSRQFLRRLLLWEEAGKFILVLAVGSLRRAASV